MIEDMQPINLSGPPVLYQFVLYAIIAVAFWLYGRTWQHGTRGLYLPNEVPFPHWIRWLCGEFNKSYGLNPHAVLLQIPPILVFVPIYLMYIFVPTAGLFSLVALVLLITYIGVIRYFHGRFILK